MRANYIPVFLLPSYFGTVKVNIDHSYRPRSFVLVYHMSFTFCVCLIADKEPKVNHSSITSWTYIVTKQWICLGAE